MTISRERFLLTESEDELVPGTYPEFLENNYKKETSGKRTEFLIDPESLKQISGESVLPCFVKDDLLIIPELENPSKQTAPLPDISAPIIRLPIRDPSTQDQIISLQKWEGYVTKISKDSILVRLIDLTEGRPEEEAEIPLEEISEEDKDLIREGAVFYWNIGYKDSKSGQRTRVSIIRFQRLPKWRKKEKDVAEQEAERLQEIIKWE